MGFRAPRMKRLPPGTAVASSPGVRLFLLIFLAAAQYGVAQQAGALTVIPFQQLSDRQLRPLGQAALGIRASDWKHAETTNFICHYFRSFVAAPVTVEAEFYYRAIAQELGKDTTHWERKSHIFVFESAEDWAEFQKRGALDPWTGGIHSGGELFIRRDPQFKFKGNTLGHEIAHLVVDSFYGSNVPLWLNEGYAEHISRRCYAAFQRARNYNARPTSRALDAANFLPLGQLTAAVTYPAEVEKVHVFYIESERLTRFLTSADKAGFSTFFDALAKGARLETALNRGFGARFPSLDALEREFKTTFSDEGGAADL